MAAASPPSVDDRTIGGMLRYWRQARHLSQLALATEADVSPRHLCFIETGRAHPSREMVMLLASVLDVPLRERNALLLAAGFAPSYPHSKLEDPDLAAVRGALEAILRQQEPFPAVVMNRYWDIVLTNDAATEFFTFLLGERKVPGSPNVLRMMCHPGGVKPFVRNWQAVAELLLLRVHRECVGGVEDETTRDLLAEMQSYPDMATAWRPSTRAASPLPIVPVCFEKDARVFNFFSTVTTLGTPQDVTAQELRIECFFPADRATDQAARSFLARA
jgi:transcriptional regulator with XRE-family HTH domain